MIIRVIHNNENPYVQITRITLEDGRLSWEARGALAYLLAKPDNWQIKTEDLARNGNCGKAKVFSILKELETCGYLERKKHKDEKGQWKWERLVYESPEINPRFLQKYPQPDFPETGNPEMVRPETGNPETEKREIYKRISNKKPTTKDPTTKQPDVVVGFSEEEILSYAWAQSNIGNVQGFTKSVIEGTATDMPRIRQSIGGWLESRGQRIKGLDAWRAYNTKQLEGYQKFRDGDVLDAINAALKKLPNITREEWDACKEHLLELDDSLEIV